MKSILTSSTPVHMRKAQVEDTDTATPSIGHTPLHQLPVEVKQGQAGSDNERTPHHSHRYMHHPLNMQILV